MNTIIPVCRHVCIDCFRSDGFSGDQWLCKPMHGHEVIVITDGASTVPARCHRQQQHETHFFQRAHWRSP